VPNLGTVVTDRTEMNPRYGTISDFYLQK